MARGGAPVLVFDASALVAWVLQTAGQWQRVEQLFGTDAELVAPVPTLAETFYIARERGNTAPFSQIQAALVARGLLLEPLIAPDAQRAAALIAESRAHPAKWKGADGKPRRGTLSLGDGLTLAIAERLRGYAVTFDQAWAHLPTLQPKLLNPWQVPLP